MSTRRWKGNLRGTHPNARSSLVLRHPGTHREQLGPQLAARPQGLEEEWPRGRRTAGTEEEAVSGTLSPSGRRGSGRWLTVPKPLGVPVSATRCGCRSEEKVGGGSPDSPAAGRPWSLPDPTPLHIGILCVCACTSQIGPARPQLRISTPGSLAALTSPPSLRPLLVPTLVHDCQRESRTGGQVLAHLECTHALHRSSSLRPPGILPSARMWGALARSVSQTGFRGRQPRWSGPPQGQHRPRWERGCRLKEMQ